MFRALLFVVCAIFLSKGLATPLDDYVNTPDDNYKWEELGSEYMMKGTGFLNKEASWTGYVVNMTSQRWLTDADFSNTSESGSIWYHALVIIVPNEIRHTNNASLYITGGSMGDIPDASSEDIKVAAALAMSTGMVTGALFQIPNEHTIFSADPIQKSRTEDAIIAFTWDHFLKDTTQPEWLLRFPMVKASLRAMDTVTAFMQTKFPELNTQLDYYTVSGASKRGWTTWDVGAVDAKRVMAIVPIVLDAINFVAVEHHQFKSYNGWSWALSDYTEEDIFTRMDTPEMKLLAENVDPYYYRDRLTMPKLVVNAVLDEFQQPDDTHYWWADMPEPKHFLMTPNAEHSEATGIFEIVPAIAKWIEMTINNEKKPRATWTIDATTGEIVATLDETGIVHEAKMWWAYSCGNNPDGIKRRDFRIMSLDAPCECGISYDGTCANLKSFWSHQVLTSTMVNGKRTFSAKMDPPTDGRYVAFMIEFSFDNLSGDASEAAKPADAAKSALVDLVDKSLPGFFPRDLKERFMFTTEVSIMPNTFPYAGCGIDNPSVPCTGTLL